MATADRRVGGGYTPGWTPDASAFMARRSAETHAVEVLPLLRPGLRLLDVGCGPGTITVGLARAVAPGRVVAVDVEPGQAELARRRAEAEGLRNVEVLVADARRLPVPDGWADVAFGHALLEHLPDPAVALAQMRRAVRPGGRVVAVSPDWGGFLLAPAEPRVERAIRLYERIQTANGGDVRAGRRLGEHMAAAGLADVRMSARFEVYEDRGAIAEYLAARIERSPELDDAVRRGWGGADEIAALARALRDWAGRPGGMFAQAWVSAVGTVPVA